MKKLLYSLILLLFLLPLRAQNTNISGGSMFDGEPYLAVDPNNTQHIVIAWMGWVNNQDLVKIHVRKSMDGGQSWSPAQTLPHIKPGHTSADPSIAFNTSGHIFISYIDYNLLNASSHNSAVVISRSTDGGFNWSAPTPVLKISVDLARRPIDRPWMVIDRSNSSTKDYIYVSTTNAKGAIPPFHPYISISNDNGNTFHWKYLDTTGWLSGSIISKPMPTPCVTTDGKLFAAYTSFLVSQYPLPRYILAQSTNGGQTFTHSTIMNTHSGITDTLPKKGYLLIAAPHVPNHLAFFFLSKINGDIDIFMRETFNGGNTWSAPIRVNDDPAGNKRMQDLVWADFDFDGSIVIAWRDRRNAPDSTYTTSYEIWGVVRDSLGLFGPNFRISNQAISYDSILGRSGNDFMSVAMQNDTIYAAWGDVRNGFLNIWFQRMNKQGVPISISELSGNKANDLKVYPNPATEVIFVEGEGISAMRVYDLGGKELQNIQADPGRARHSIDVSSLPAGVYILDIVSGAGHRYARFMRR